MMKPIETIYNGYRFRSRLEARWAVFFDTLGVKYEYEKEGFDMDGVWYLPDFYLPDYSCWVEIKGCEKQYISKKEMNKINRFITKKKFWLICGSPDSQNNSETEPSYEVYVSICGWFKKINKFEYWEGVEVGDSKEDYLSWVDDLDIVDEKITLNDIKKIETIDNSLLYQYAQECLDTEYGVYNFNKETTVSIKDIKLFFDTMMDSRCLFGACSNCHKLSIHPYWAMGYDDFVGMNGVDFVSFCGCGGRTRWPKYANDALLTAKQARFEFSDYMQRINKTR